MAVYRVSLTEAKQKLGELVKRTAYGGDRFILEFRGKPQAALVTPRDLERLEEMTGPGEEGTILADLGALRRELATRGSSGLDSIRVLGEVRQERRDELSGLR